MIIISNTYRREVLERCFRLRTALDAAAAAAAVTAAGAVPTAGLVRVVLIALLGLLHLAIAISRCLTVAAE
jgi:hypothetical protein